MSTTLLCIIGLSCAYAAGALTIWYFTWMRAVSIILRERALHQHALDTLADPDDCTFHAGAHEALTELCSYLYIATDDGDDDDSHDETTVTG